MPFLSTVMSVISERETSSARGDHIQGLGVQMSGAAVQVPELLIGVDLYHIFRGNDPGGQKQLALFKEGFLPKGVVLRGS